MGQLVGGRGAAFAAMGTRRKHVEVDVEATCAPLRRRVAGKALE